MTFKINIYKVIFFNVETKKGISKKHYFKKVETINNITTKEVSNAVMEATKRHTDDNYHVSLLTEHETDNLIEEHNRKMRKYMRLAEV